VTERGKPKMNIDFDLRKLWRPSFFAVFFLWTTAAALSQTPSSPAKDEPDFIVPARPTFSNPAEFQRPGVLQLEYGYNANFRAPGVRAEQDTPLALRFAASKRILLEMDIDGVITQTDEDRKRATGFGDCQLGIQVVLMPENDRAPGIALAYYIKAPTASSAKGLGSGRVDHTWIALISKTIGRTTLDFNAIYLLAGRVSRQGYASSGQAAFAVSQGLTKRVGVQGEISGFSRNDLQPGAMVVLAVATYQVNNRLVFDGGVRFGLTSNAPATGIVAGLTIGISDLYKKKH